MTEEHLNFVQFMSMFPKLYNIIAAYSTQTAVE